MKISVHSKNIDKFKYTKKFIEDRCKKLERYLDPQVKVQWICELVQETYEVEAKIIGPKFEYFAASDAKEIETAIDCTLKKIEKQAKRKLDRWHGRRQDQSVDELKILDPEQAWALYDEDKAS